MRPVGLKFETSNLYVHNFCIQHLFSFSPPPMAEKNKPQFSIIYPLNTAQCWSFSRIKYLVNGIYYHFSDLFSMYKWMFIIAISLKLFVCIYSKKLNMQVDLMYIDIQSKTPLPLMGF